MKTVLHTYNFDLDNPAHREPYHQLKLKLEKTPGRGHKMHAIKPPGEARDYDPGEIELETEFLFENQWNANIGRVFDWWEEYVVNRPLIKRGHYLEITPEMVAIRRDTLKCGYTGQQFPAADFADKPKFNTTHQALGNCFLKESELHLVRLLPVSDEFTGKREPLTDAERDWLLPLYVAAQSKTQGEKRAKQIEEVKRKHDKEAALALTERDGMLWLLEHGVNIENCIFYDHTNTFCFGWRSPYGANAEQALQEAINGFPYQYEIKTQEAA